VIVDAKSSNNWLLAGAYHMRLAVLFIGVITSTVPAVAQFKKVEPQQLQDVTSLECGIIKATDSERSDPIYKINVTLTLEQGELKEIWVAHTSVSGEVYVRSEQYQQSAIWQTPGRKEWYWRATRVPRTMLGEVWRNPTNQWWYSEKLFKNGTMLGRVDGFSQV
jgi:hypothetical protein